MLPLKHWEKNVEKFEAMFPAKSVLESNKAQYFNMEKRSRKMLTELGKERIISFKRITHTHKKNYQCR